MKMMSFKTHIAKTSRMAVSVCAAFLLAMTVARAQDARITLPEREVTLRELFGQIKRQTGRTVMFDADNTALDRKVTLPATSGTVSRLLQGVLPDAGYDWMILGGNIAVGPRRTEPVVAAAVQPTHDDFERDVTAYTENNLATPVQPTVRYDTLRVERSLTGVFEYPAREFTPRATTRPAKSVFERTTPPVLAAKTNLAWWAARGTLNIGGEVGLGRRTTLDLAGGINRRNLRGTGENNKKLAHWVVKPEFRYWLCERFNGHFLGVHALYAQYNVGGYDVPTLFKREFRYEGNAWGAGVNWGYHLPLAQRWGVEFTAGVGVLSLNYKQSDCEKCGGRVGEDVSRTWFGPTNLGARIVFMIK